MNNNNNEGIDFKQIVKDIVPHELQEDALLVESTETFINTIINISMSLPNANLSKVPSFIRTTLKNFFKQVGGIKYD